MANDTPNFTCCAANSNIWWDFDAKQIYQRQLLSVAHTSNFALSRLILGNYLPTLHQFGRYWDQKTFGKIIQWQILITLDRIHHAAKGKVFSCCTITFGKGVMRYISLSGNISIPILDMHAAYVPTALMECIIKNTTGLPIVGVAVMITGSQQPFPASVIRTFQLDDVRLRFLCIVAVIIGMVYWVMLIN